MELTRPRVNPNIQYGLFFNVAECPENSHSLKITLHLSTYTTNILRNIFYTWVSTDFIRVPMLNTFITLFTVIFITLKPHNPEASKSVTIETHFDHVTYIVYYMYHILNTSLMK